MIFNFHKELVTNNAIIMTRTHTLIYIVVDRDERLLFKYSLRPMLLALLLFGTLQTPYIIYSLS